jgi:RHS repeat-associated protein
MVAFVKPHLKTHTRCRSAKDSGHRFYSPEIARWLSRDPIGEIGGANVYVFCANNAVDSFDVLGMKTDKISGIMELLKAAVSLKVKCCGDKDIVAYADCLIDGIFYNKDEIKAWAPEMDKLAENIGKAQKAVGNIKTAADALNFIQYALGKEKIDPELLNQMSSGLGMGLDKVIGPVSDIAKLGASASKVDALDFLLTLGDIFGPKPLSQWFSFYKDAYQVSTKAIKSIKYKGGKASLLTESADMFCPSFYDTAKVAISSQFQDDWDCYKILKQPGYEGWTPFWNK